LRHLILDLQDARSGLEPCRKPVLAALHGACSGQAYVASGISTLHFFVR